MSDRLALLHTSPVLVEPFENLARELAPDVPLSHAVDESLLAEARDSGGVTPHLNRRVAAAIYNAADSGARVIMCTCSSIGACVDVTRPFVDQPLLRVDRPMADEAVRTGTRIAVAATLTTTLVPTRDVIRQAGSDAGIGVDVTEVLCETAWAALEQGDRQGYLDEIVKDLRKAAAAADVIVLAQASMAAAAEQLADLGTPILTSPRSGFEAAVAAWRSAG